MVGPNKHKFHTQPSLIYDTIFSGCRKQNCCRKKETLPASSNHTVHRQGSVFFLMMAATPVMSSASSRTGTGVCRLHTGIITITAAVMITAVSRSVMGMPSSSRTARCRTDRYAVAGSVAIAALMIISAIAPAVMDMMPALRTAGYRTDSDRITGSVTITVHMIITTVSTAVMDMPADLCTAVYGTNLAQMFMIIAASGLAAMMPMRRNRHHKHPGKQNTSQSQSHCLFQIHTKQSLLNTPCL